MRNPPPDILQRIGVEKLAALPQSTLRLLQACNDPDVGFSELTEIVTRDTGLASRILSVASSPAYAQWNGERDLNRLMVVLGIGTIKAIALTSGVIELFSRLGHCRERHLGRIWYLSLHCAELAKGLAAETGLAHSEEAYLAGLLHRVGQWVLLNGAPDRYPRFMEIYGEPHRLLQLEQEYFGIDHAELGAWLTAQWRLGDLFSDALRYQWEDPQAILDTPNLVRLINLCAQLTDPGSRVRVQAEAGTTFGLDGPALEDHLCRADAEAQEAATLFGINIEVVECPPNSPPEELPFPPERGQLAALVKDSALIETVRAAMYEQSESLDPLVTIQTFLSVLFGFEYSVFFLRQNGNRLTGQALGEEDAWVRDFRVVLAPGRSLLCDALLRNRQLDSFEYAAAKRPLNVVDRQLIRRLGSSGILAIPLFAGDERLGVALIGVEPGVIDGLRSHRDLLERFAREAARLLLKWRADQERTRLQVAQARAEVLKRVQEIRHEAANPLGIASNYLHVLHHKLGEDASVKEELDIVQQEIARAGDLLSTLVPADLTGSERKRPLRLADLVETLVRVLRPALFEPRTIEVEVDLDPHLPALNVDGDRLKQVVLNLLRNAAEAMPQGGRIRISAKDHLISAEGEFLDLVVADTGPGLPPEVRAQLFRPLVSGKGGQHAGLGLSISYDLMRKMGGGLECRTGQAGSEFHILIPRRTP